MQRTGAEIPGKPWVVTCPDVIIPPDASMMAFAKLANLGVENALKFRINWSFPRQYRIKGFND